MTNSLLDTPSQTAHAHFRRVHRHQEKPLTPRGWRLPWCVLYAVGTSGRMWHLIANFLSGTLSQVRIGDSTTQPWVDSGIAQGRASSPLLFNVLVDTLAIYPQRRSWLSGWSPQMTTAIPASFTQTMRFSCLSHKSICRQVSMHVTLGAFAGASLLV